MQGQVFPDGGDRLGAAVGLSDYNTVELPFCNLPQAFFLSAAGRRQTVVLHHTAANRLRKSLTILRFFKNMFILRHDIQSSIKISSAGSVTYAARFGRLTIPDFNK